MKAKDLQRGLEAKLKLRRKEEHRHIDYCVMTASGQIALPTMIRVSPADGDVPARNLRGIATALGLRDEELSRMVRCHISGRCASLAICNRLLHFVSERLAQQGVLFMPGLEAMLSSIDRLLDELPDAGTRAPTTDESFLMARCSQELTALLPDTHVGQVADRIHRLIVSRADTNQA